jgi:squalene-hopene/tetraprenyl-beta-curcumene cyclase
LVIGPAVTRAADEVPAGGWNKAAAGDYLDTRMREWFEFAEADRGEEPTMTSCVCCHTVVPYAVARPVLRKLSGVVEPTEFESRLIAQTRKRVANWADLETEQFGLISDANDQKKKESYGTEAVLNAVILAFDDYHRGQQAPSDGTKKAFDHLWGTQLKEGERKGSWEWLHIGPEPWESKGAKYYGAALAAIAVGTAPGYYTRGSDPELDTHVDLLRRYLKENLAGQNDYNRVWMLLASTKLDGLLDDVTRSQIVARIASKRNPDGGWSLSVLGGFPSKSSFTQVTSSDGYATGLVLHVLQSAGIGKDDPKVRPGLAWLRANQKPSGPWQGYSVNTKRYPESSDELKAFVGKFMWDAATSYAVLALSHAE